MASSLSNENRPRIPGRCDICDFKDGKRKMNFVQCIKCKVCVHRECYLVFPEGDGKDFVCFACAAIGRTFQAVDSHRSDQFYEIEVKERPRECALCNVSDGVHAMYPLFDYHGRGGRQICYVAKNKDNPKQKGRVLAWGHALCCLYLASMNFMYACYKDGVYIGTENEDDPDMRPPNPELQITPDFQRMYGDAMPHFRYYMTPPNEKNLDPWTKAVRRNQTELKCIECGLSDQKHSMRIPVQCVANDEDEYFEHKEKHRQRNNDVHPCTQALHVGCGRWGDRMSTVRKVYYFPGSTNDDGTLKDDKLDTVRCLYCKTHAENVDMNHQRRVQKHQALLERKKAAEKERMQAVSTKTSMRIAVPSTATRMIKKRPPVDPRPLPSLSKTSKKDEFVSKRKNCPTKVGRNTNTLPAVPKPNRGWRKYRNQHADRHDELDPSVAVPINAGQQPTLAKRRREIANEMSVVTEKDCHHIVDDLMKHENDITQKSSSVMTINARKRYWKHKLSGMSTKDFDTVWRKALEIFHDRNKKPNDTSRQSAVGKQLPTRSLETADALGSERDSSSCDSTLVSFKARGNRIEHNEDGNLKIAAGNDGNDSTANNDVDLNASKGKGEIERGMRGADQFSKFFIGEAFKIGSEFTLSEFEETL